MGANEPDDRLLVEAAQRDPACFAEVYRLHFERVYAYVLGRVHRREEAEDLTGEVFRKALGSIDRFEWRGVPLSAWLYRLAANAISDWAARGEQIHETAMPEDPPAPDEGPDLEKVERRSRVFRMVSTLPADQRRVIELRFAEEKSIREIAEAMGRSEGAVKQLQFRAIERLRSRMSSPRGGAHA